MRGDGVIATGCRLARCRRLSVTALCIFGLTTADVSASGFPVVDVANLAQTIQQVQMMLDQLEQMKSQLQTAKLQYNSMNNVRNMAGIISSQYDLDMTATVDDVLRDAGINRGQLYKLDRTSQRLFDRRADSAARNYELHRRSMQQAIDRFDELKRLVSRVNSAPQTKDVMDLQARIQAEQALLENEQIKLQMMQGQASAERQLHELEALQRQYEMVNQPMPTLD